MNIADVESFHGDGINQTLSDVNGMVTKDGASMEALATVVNGVR